MAGEIQKVGVVKSMAELQGTMDAYRESIAKVCTKALSPERVVNLLLACALREPRIATCTKASLLETSMIAAQLGLEFGGPLGQCWPQVYWNGKLQANECKFMIGYRGMIDLSLRSGRVSFIESRLVYANDRFEIHQGSERKIVHEPDPFSARGELRGGYAISWLNDDNWQYDVMSKAELDAIKARTKSRDRNGNIVGPWITDEPEMQRKTLIRRLWKMLPASVEMKIAMEADPDAGEYVTAQLAAEVEPRSEQGRTNLQRRLAEEKAKAKPPTIPETPPEPASSENAASEPKDGTYGGQAAQDSPQGGSGGGKDAPEPWMDDELSFVGFAEAVCKEIYGSDPLAWEPMKSHILAYGKILKGAKLDNITSEQRKLIADKCICGEKLY